uniref:Uncharacterized protein n=1 Tax=Solanum lycopersicum TaxID=4081 RepID=A0A3Q7IW86_SOLLC
MPVLAKAMQGEISEHLPKDQELAASSCVPMKILAHPNNAIGKLYGVEHSGRVRGLGGNIYPSNAFGVSRIQLVMRILGSSSSMSHQHVGDLEKHVETLKERDIKRPKNSLRRPNKRSRKLRIGFRKSRSLGPSSRWVGAQRGQKIPPTPF